MKKKLIISLALVVTLIAIFAVSVSAKEFIVNTADEFNTAYAEATDGDTIVIKASISATHDFGKSITYILDGDGIIWTAGAQNTATGKSVTVASKGGNNSFKPNSSMWCNSYGLTVADLSTTSWTFEALDESSTIKLDLSSVSTRLFYGTYLGELNFKYGAHVINCNNTKSDNTFYLYSKTINMYEGSKIYGNQAQSYRGFMQTNTLNIYGGEIYGNRFNEYGMLIAINGTSTVNMYGGKIYNNYIYFGNTGVTEGIFNNATLNMYEGEITSNYVKGADSSKHTILAGTKRLISGGVYDNYFLSSWTAPTVNENGIYHSEIDLTSATKLTYGAGSTTLFNHSVIFKNADSSVVNAYMIKDDGTVLKSVDGSTAITVPNSELGWTTKMNYCVASSVDTSKQGTYYLAVDHTIVDDHNCETALSCTVCSEVFAEAITHILVDAIVYENGFLDKGIRGVVCQNEGCTAANETNEIDALFVFGGYSVPLEGEKNSIAYTVKVNYEMIKAYKELTGKVFKYGIVASSSLENKNPVLENGTPNEGSAMAELTGTEYSILKIRITNIDDPSQELHCCAYYIFDDKVMYIGKDGLSEKAESVKLNDFN